MDRKSIFVAPGREAAQRLTSEEEMRLMEKGMRKLYGAKEEIPPDGIALDFVKAHQKLQRFVCWGTTGEGVTLRRSGGRFNRSTYYQVSVSRNRKYMGHKLSLCNKLGIGYSTLEGTGMETSHLCHRHSCWNPDHLVAEGHKENMGRSTCPGWLYAVEDDQLFCLCEHVPHSCKHVHVRRSLRSIEVCG